MKVSVSLPEEEVAYLDSYAKEHGMGSRSAVVHQAVGLLRSRQLEAAYEEAWSTWAESGDADVWEVTAADSLDSDERDS
ncbi:MAG TPA: ribbon-helix-helix domain-containing protein [Streptosporangiaceae bacterium]|jgi:Arc/MetJ-type ribon-helix-helix transcriptional regulator